MYGQSVFEVHFSTIKYGCKIKRAPHVMYASARDEDQAVRAVQKWVGSEFRLLYVEERPDGSFIDAALYLGS